VKNKAILWDSDGTITGALNPQDKRSDAKIILPGVAKTMAQAHCNFVISGFKSPESEAQDFEPQVIIDKFIGLMNDLPISAAAFSPQIGGVACDVVLKKDKPHSSPKCDTE